jgi:hypothetical protein
MKIHRIPGTRSNAPRAIAVDPKGITSSIQLFVVEICDCCGHNTMGNDDRPLSTGQGKARFSSWRSGWILRRNKFGKIDFGYMFEGVMYAQVNNDGVITKICQLTGQRRMASAIDTGIATIKIIVLFERGTRARVRCGKFRRGYLNACRCHVTLHGMSTFVNDIDCCGQHDHEENQGKEFQREYYSHK